VSYCYHHTMFCKPWLTILQNYVSIILSFFFYFFGLPFNVIIEPYLWPRKLEKEKKEQYRKSWDIPQKKRMIIFPPLNNSNRASKNNFETPFFFDKLELKYFFLWHPNPQTSFSIFRCLSSLGFWKLLSEFWK